MINLIKIKRENNIFISLIEKFETNWFFFFGRKLEANCLICYYSAFLEARNFIFFLFYFILFADYYVAAHRPRNCRIRALKGNLCVGQDLYHLHSTVL